MEIFTRFNRKRIDGRHVEALVPLSQELIADQKIDEEEAQRLLSWLLKQREASGHPVIINLLNKLTSMLDDGVLDPQEGEELFTILRKIAGDPAVLGQLGVPAALPIDQPLPSVIFKRQSFLYAGTFAYGTRKQVYAATAALGGRNNKLITRSLNYLVLGTYVTDSWAQESFAQQIVKAINLREQGARLRIVTEDHWINSGDLD